jgi:hypothetical protein
MASSCGYVDEHTGSIKDWEFVEFLCNNRLYNNNSAYNSDDGLADILVLSNKVYSIPIT